MTDHADLTKHGPWRAERVWSKHHERIPDRWEWLIEDDAGVVAIVPADDPEHAEAVARSIAGAADALDAADAENARLAQWKAEALAVLGAWDRVHEALGSPARLGESTALASHNEAERVGRERDEALADKAKLVSWIQDRINDGSLVAWVEASAREALRAVLAVSEEATDG